MPGAAWPWARERYDVKRLIVLAVVLSAGAALAACGGGGGDVKHEDLFFIGDEIGVNDEDQPTIRIGLRNNGVEPFEGDAQFAGFWEVRENTRWGDVVIKHLINQVGPIGPGETVFVDEWSGQIEGTLFLLWGAPGYGAVETRFVVYGNIEWLHLPGTKGREEGGVLRNPKRIGLNGYPKQVPAGQEKLVN